MFSCPNENQNSKKYSVAAIRTEHANAYRSWVSAEDENLKKLNGAGKDITELAKIFGRNEGAIRSRLIRFGL